MLLTAITTNFQTRQAELQAELERVQAEIRQIGDRERRMESCLAVLREILEDSQKHPQELLIFSSAIDDELSSFGFIGGSNKADEDELAELKDKLKRITSDRDHLLIKLGESKQKVHDDAKRDIAQLEARVAELDKRNMELEKCCDQTNQLWLQTDEKRVKLQIELDQLKEAIAKKEEEQPLPEPSVKLAYQRRIEKMASDFFGHEITTQAELKEAIAAHSATTSEMEDGLNLEGREFYKAAEVMLQQLSQGQKPATPEEELNSTLNPMRELMGIPTQPASEAPEAEESDSGTTQPSYSQQVRAIASNFFGFEIKNKAGLKKALRYHPKTTFMQATSLEVEGKAFYEAAEAQIKRLIEAQESTPEPEATATAHSEPEQPKFTQTSIWTPGESSTIPVENLRKLPAEQLRALADKKGIPSFGSLEAIAWDLKGQVTPEEIEAPPSIPAPEPEEVTAPKSIPLMPMPMPLTMPEAELDKETQHDALVARLNNCKGEEEFMTIALSINPKLSVEEREEILGNAIIFCDAQPKFECTHLFNSFRFLLRKKWAEVPVSPVIELEMPRPEPAKMSHLLVLSHETLTFVANQKGIDFRGRQAPPKHYRLLF